MSKVKYLTNEPTMVIQPSLACLYDWGGVILQQIHYWLNTPNVGIMHEGHRWVYNSYSQWQDQFPWLSKNTIIKYIQKMEDDGVLISKRIKASSNNQVKHYRIDYQKLVHLLEGAIPETGTSYTKIWYKGVPETGCSIHIEHQIVTDNTTSVNPSGSPQISDNKSEIPEGEEMGKGPTDTMAILNHLKEKEAAKAGKPTKVTSATLQNLWRDVVGKDQFVAEFTAKKKGQFSHILKKVGADDAVKVVSYVLQNWIPYTKYVENSSGVSNTPSSPNVDFLLKYVSEAKTYWMESLPKVKSVAPKKSVTVVPVVSKPKEKPATLAELKAAGLI